MAHYLLQVAYTPEAWTSLVNAPQDRSKGIEGAVKNLGGKVERFYLSFGDYDIIGVVEMPDSVSAAAFSMAVAAGGAGRRRSKTVLDLPEIDETGRDVQAGDVNDACSRRGGDVGRDRSDKVALDRDVADRVNPILAVDDVPAFEYEIVGGLRVCPLYERHRCQQNRYARHARHPTSSRALGVPLLHGPAGRVFDKAQQRCFSSTDPLTVEARMSDPEDRRSFTPQRLSRRSLLGLFGALGSSSLVGAREGSTAGIAETAAQRTATAAAPVVSPYQALGVRPIINARGTFTIIGGNIELPEVQAVKTLANQQHAHMDELEAAAGKRLAELTGAEWGMVSAGCSAAISHATAACLAGGNPEMHVRLPNLTGFPKDEVIIPTASRNQYDAAVRALGVKIIEVDSPESLQLALGPRTAMIYIMAGPSNETGPMSTEAICAAAKARISSSVSRISRKGTARERMVGSRS
jgi:uncharacterized protein with GYD domain